MPHICAWFRYALHSFCGNLCPYVLWHILFLFAINKIYSHRKIFSCSASCMIVLWVHYLISYWYLIISWEQTARSLIDELERLFNDVNIALETENPPCTSTVSDEDLELNEEEATVPNKANCNFHFLIIIFLSIFVYCYLDVEIALWFTV